MPELPEVHTITTELKQKIIGKTIKSVDMYKEKSFQGDKRLITGKKIKKISRRAKVIIIELNGVILAIHLKMTGQLVFQKKKDESQFKHIRVILNFSDKNVLIFNDLRIFGWIKIIKPEELNKIVSNFGVEPFSKEFTYQKLLETLKNRKIAIKLALTDQTKISGLGNIYVNEVLFCAQINPKKPANKINENEAKRISKCTIKILKKAIKYKGTTAENYLRTDGKPGEFDKHLLIYGKKDKPCPKCGAFIERIALGGRGTFFCPKCQK